jgi:hypothetical protein
VAIPTSFLVEACGWKPISNAEKCPIIAENGATTGLVAYFSLGGVIVDPGFETVP